MRKALSLFFLIATSFLCSCLVLSVDPLYTSKDVLFDEELLGRWQNEEALVQFEKKGDSYHLTWTEDDEVIQFKATLLRLKGRLFLDLETAEEPEDELLLLPVHMFARIRMEGSNLTVQMMETDAVETMAKEGKLAMGHKLSPGPAASVLLTGTTEELQKFVLQNADKVFGEEAVFQKK